MKTLFLLFLLACGTMVEAQKTQTNSGALDVEALEKMLNMRVEHLEREIDLRYTLGELAINKSEAAMLERMEASNGKYALLKEQADKFPTRTEIDQAIRMLETRVQNLQKFMYMLIGGAGSISIHQCCFDNKVFF